MSFPPTRVTLIRRLAGRADENDWRQFFADYWEPLCAFASRWGHLSAEDAEDVVSGVFLVLWESDLLARWQCNQCARLRTVLCGIACRLISNRSRIAAGRAQILSELAMLPKGQAPAWIIAETARPEVDVFYSEWVAGLLRQSFDRLLLQCHREGKGDYFRVLYGRLCEGLTMREIAASLSLETTTAENYLKTCKSRLTKELERAVRTHVERYGDKQDRDDDDDFTQEWNDLLSHLQAYGGIENAVRTTCQRLDGVAPSVGASSVLQETMSRICKGTSNGSQVGGSN